MKLILSFVILITFSVQNTFGQDSIIKTHPIPRRAAILSALIPGSGQIYNSVYSTNKTKHVLWKVPVIYASLYFAGSSLISKIKEEKDIRTEYSNRVNHNLYSQKWIAYDNYNLVLLQQNAAKTRNTLYFITGGVYLIQILEASIDAHFSHFDISPDLSLNIQPYYSNYCISGLSFAFNIK